MIENEFILEDRIAKIKAINEQYDLESNAYLSFSGGKDSTILHYLLDLALPNNKIPRVFINTGIEYKAIVDFVKSLQEKDNRFVLIQPTQNIKTVLETFGYPFKSKQHSHDLAIYQHSKKFTLTTYKYLGIIPSKTLFKCPKCLEYQFSPDFNLKISDQCCQRLKKTPVRNWEKENNKTIVLTGMRKDEGNQRTKLTCVVTDKNGDVVKFHPLVVVSSEWEDWFLSYEDVKVCELYYEPYNFQRTGCKGCPFSLDLQKQLDTMAKLLPNEKTQCEQIWKPVYDEYRKIGYRLRKEEEE
jgi:3'-phosphoadenosine 5'-phosphosulfate sulfotransferase (PAPS reductase)/FAD synthetase